MRRRNHKPMRTCLGCRTRDAQDAMVRLAAVGARVSVDEARRLGGRGGYLHPRRECLENFARAKVRECRSLRVALDREARSLVTQTLRAWLDSRGALE